MQQDTCYWQDSVTYIYFLLDTRITNRQETPRIDSLYFHTWEIPLQKNIIRNTNFFTKIFIIYS